MKSRSNPKNKISLAERITGHRLSSRDLVWIERQLPKASGQFARLLILLLLLDAWKRRNER